MSSKAPGYLTPPSLLALIWTTFAIATLFVLTRTAIRFRLLSTLQSEDYWMFFALATLLTNAVLQTLQLPSLYYMSAIIAGELAPTSSTELVSIGELYLKYEFATIGLFWTVLWAVKASFLAVYFKLFRDVARYRIVWYGLAGFTFAAYVGCWITSVFSCRPVGNFFRFAQCNKPEDVWGSRMSVYYSTAVDIGCDLFIMAMPIRLIYNIKISVKQKVGLVFVFSLALVMIVLAVIRARQILAENYFVNLILLMVWSTLESSISVVVGCLPAFKTLISSRAATQRSKNGSSTGRSAYKPSATRQRSGSVPMGSFTHEPKSFNGRYHTSVASDSQEAIVKCSNEQERGHIVVKNDVTVEYGDVDQPPPTFHRHQPIGRSMGRPF